MNKKPQYRPAETDITLDWRGRPYDRGDCDKNAFYHKYVGVFRSLRHAWVQERRAREDAIQQGVNVPKRKGKYAILNPWEDYPASRWKAKSWKDSHKCRKQWMKNL